MKVERTDVVLRLSKNEAADMARVMKMARYHLVDAVTGGKPKSLEIEESIAFLYWLEKALHVNSVVPKAAGMSRNVSAAFNVGLRASKEECSEEDGEATLEEILAAKDAAENKLTRSEVVDMSEMVCKCDCCDDRAVCMIRGLGVFCMVHGREALEKDRIMCEEQAARKRAENLDCSTHNAPDKPVMHRVKIGGAWHLVQDDFAAAFNEAYKNATARSITP